MASPKLVYHIDDSLIAQRFTRELFHKLVDDESKVVSFSNADALLAAIQEKTPDCILTDINMPGLDGIELIRMLKRHPIHHRIPFAVLSAELKDEENPMLKRLGVFLSMVKPATQETIKLFITQLRERDDFGADEWSQFEQQFYEESRKQLEECESALESLNAESFNSLERGLHTLKGGAFSLQFPTLAEAVHKTEDFTRSFIPLGGFPDEVGHEHLRNMLRFFNQCLDCLQEGLEFAEAPQSLLTPLIEYCAKHKAFIEAAKAKKLEMASSGEAAPAPLPGQPLAAQVNVAKNTNEVVKTSSAVRIPNAKLDEIQGKLRKVLSAKVKLAKFSRELSGEFSDEQFPQELEGYIHELETHTTELFEFFLSLRLQSPERLKPFAERILAETGQFVGKKAKMSFDFEPNFEIDSFILETIEASITHLIRNSMDHGIEDAAGRAAANKSAEGSLTLSLHRGDGDTVQVVLRDDGRGVNTGRIKEKLVSQGVFSQEAVDKLPESSIIQCLFMDAFSTKEEVNEISGRGVGLSSVKESIEKYGGTIRIDSELGRGCSFNITIPRVVKLQ